MPTPAEFAPTQQPEAIERIALTRDEVARLGDMAMGTEMNAEDREFLVSTGITPGVAPEEIPITILGDEGEEPEHRLMAIHEGDFGTLVSKKEEARRQSAEASETHISVVDQSEETPVVVSVQPKAEQAASVPEVFTLEKQELPAVFEELATLGRLPDVAADPAAAQYHERLVRDSNNEVMAAAQGGHISEAMAALRLARNIGATTNRDTADAAVDTLRHILAPEELKQFTEALSGFAGSRGRAIDTQAVQQGIASFVRANREQKRPKVAQLMQSVAYGASYRMPEKSQAAGFRDYLSKDLIASLQKIE